MWCVPRASSCPKTNWWSLLWAKNGIEKQASLGSCCSRRPMHAYRRIRQGCRHRFNADAPKRLGLYGHPLAPRLAKARQNEGCRHCLGRVLQPGHRLFSLSGPTKRHSALHEMRLVNAPFHMRSDLAGCIVRSRSGVASFSRTQPHNDPLIPTRLVGSIKRVASYGNNAAMEITLHPLCKKHPQPPGMDEPRSATNHNCHLDGKYQPQTPKTHPPPPFDSNQNSETNTTQTTQSA